MKDSFWRRIRRRWVMWRYRLDEAAADDLLAGIDLGDHDCAAPWPAEEVDDFWAEVRKCLDEAP